jgi:hypothetical protein
VCTNSRAVCSADHSRRRFGTFIDTWHSDLQTLSELPTVAEQDEADEETAAAAWPDRSR